MDVVVKRAGLLDGRFDLIPFNRYEQGQIRRLSGWMPMEYEKALSGGDAELITAIAVLSMRRAGRVEREDVRETFERLLDMDEAEITLDGRMDEVDQDPPQRSSSLNSDTSGPGSGRNSETLAKTPPLNGTHDSGISESDRPRLVS